MFGFFIFLSFHVDAAERSDLDSAIKIVSDTKYRIALSFACGVPVTSSPSPQLERFASALEINAKGLKGKLSQQDFEEVMNTTAEPNVASSIAQKVSEGARSGECNDQGNIKFWEFLRQASKIIKQ